MEWPLSIHRRDAEIAEFLDQYFLLSGLGVSAVNA
jgi:hypothetical protein